MNYTANSTLRNNSKLLVLAISFSKEIAVSLEGCIDFTDE